MGDRKQSGESPPGLGFVATLALFGGFALLLFGITHGVIPALATRSGIEPVLLWFSCSGLGVFLPLLIAAVILLRGEGRRLGPDLWQQRLRFRKLSRQDWGWSIAGLAAIGVLAFAILSTIRYFVGEVRLGPSFAHLEPLGPGRYWILGVWLPFFVLNIMSEEILWRGVMLPRQEAEFGRRAWLFNAVGWLLFHVPFGPVICAMIAPIAFVLPWIVQRCRNSSIGVVIHGGLNGAGFLATAFGFA